MYVSSCVSHHTCRPQEKGEGKGEGEGGTLQSTGHLGDVMKESTEIAYTYAKVELIFAILGCVTLGNGVYRVYIYTEFPGDERQLKFEKCQCPPPHP